MRVKNWLIAMAGAVMLAGMATLAQAAPAGGLTGDLKTTAEQMSPIDQVRYRCWWHRGHRHCRRVHRHYGYYYGPSFGIYFGGHRHWRHRHWGHRHWRHRHHRRHW